MFDKTLPCEITTPFGSAVVPEVKMISSGSCGLDCHRVVSVRSDVLQVLA